MCRLHCFSSPLLWLDIRIQSVYFVYYSAECGSHICKTFEYQQLLGLTTVITCCTNEHICLWVCINQSDKEHLIWLIFSLKGYRSICTTECCLKCSLKLRHYFTIMVKWGEKKCINSPAHLASGLKPYWMNASKMLWCHWTGCVHPCVWIPVCVCVWQGRGYIARGNCQSCG